MAIRSNFPSIKPSLLLDFANTKALDPRITFTRATTATYYDGLTTAKAEENLLTYSEQFDNAAWAKTNATVTANATTAPDGTTTADTINGSAGSAYILEALTVTSGITYTFSVYAKANTTNFLQIAGGSSGFGTGVWANFDLSGGTVGTTGALTTASIQSIGSGWYRCVITGTATASISPGNIFALIPVESSSATRFPTNAGTTSIYVWGAQLEQRSSVTAYTATTTQPITNYIPVLQTAASGVPRFDHNPTTDESLGLLIEEQRTNLQIRSQEFDNAEWSPPAGFVSPNIAVAPDGTQTADKLVALTSVSGQFVGGSGISTATTAHTFTAYLKAGEYSWSILYVTGANVGVYFNLSNGTIGSTFVGAPTSSSITSVGNGWYRCSITFTATATTGCRIYVRTSDGQGSFAGNGFNGIYAWGAQLEAGAFATSYIPTVASTVTRNADAASMTGTNFSSWINLQEGTLYGDVVFNSGSVTADQILFQVDDGSNSQRHKISRYAAVFYGTTRISGSTVVDMSFGTANSNTAYRVTYGYKLNDFAGTSNAGTVATDTSGTLPLSLTTANIGRNGAGGEYVNGTIKKIAYYPLRVTNAQLQALTS